MVWIGNPAAHHFMHFLWVKYIPISNNWFTKKLLDLNSFVTLKQPKPNIKLETQSRSITGLQISVSTHFFLSQVIASLPFPNSFPFSLNVVKIGIYWSGCLESTYTAFRVNYLGEKRKIPLLFTCFCSINMSWGFFFHVAEETLTFLGT